MPHYTGVKHYGSFGNHDRRRPASPPRLPAHPLDHRQRRRSVARRDHTAGVEYLGDRQRSDVPGTTGPEAIAGMLGRVPETMTFHPTRRRYPIVALRMPIAALRSIRRIRALAAPTEQWWRAQIIAAAVADETRARAMLTDGAAQFRELMTVHGRNAFAERILNRSVEASTGTPPLPPGSA
jgi:hypothetical protein